MREREGPETAFGSPDGPPGQAAEGFFARICTEGRAEPWMADVWRSIDEKYTELAVRTLHDAFELHKPDHA